MPEDRSTIDRSIWTARPTRLVQTARESIDSWLGVSGAEILLLRVALSTGEAEVIDAGSLRMFRRRRGEIEPVKLDQQMPLGMFGDTRYRVQPVSFLAGDRLPEGGLLIITAILFKQGTLNATTQTIAWAVIFFFASPGARAGYLTASEVFPLEVRAKAIAAFFAIAQFFGLLGTHLYGHLIGTGNDPNKLFVGYLIGARAMIVGGVAEIIFGVAAEGKSLEDIAAPLSMVRKAVGSVDATKSPPPLRGQAT